MRWFATLLLFASLGLGVLAAATAYLVPLDLPDGQIEGLTLASDLFSQLPRENPDQAPAKLASKEETGDDGMKKRTTLTPGLLASLRAHQVRYVRVKEFDAAIWPGKWFFALGVAGLMTSAVLMRVGARKQLAASRSAGAGPLPILREISSTVATLRRELLDLAGEASQQRLVLERLTPLQQFQMTDFGAARGVLIAQLGLAGYAQLMDVYARAERQINRAWSAAADGYLDESLDCLAAAEPLLEECLAMLGSTNSGPAEPPPDHEAPG